MIQTRQYEIAAKEAGFQNLNNACKFARVYLLLSTWNPDPIRNFFREHAHETIDLLCLIDCFNQLEAMKLPRWMGKTIELRRNKSMVAH